MKYFKNWSSEDFTWSWDGQETTIKAGEIKPMEDFLANHFAKHLTNRELQKDEKPLVCGEREEYFNKCFAEVEVKEEITEKKKVKKIKKSKKVSGSIESNQPFEDLKNETTNKKRGKKKNSL